MKVNYCFLKKFNNYFNRKIIQYYTVDDYITHSEEHYIPATLENGVYVNTPFDFNPNDNITTEIIANDVPFDPDYLLIFDALEGIFSRWFVIEQKRNRQGQWLYQLKRDVISDNLENLMNAPIFVEKGMVGEEDPFIVNSEGMSLNQIKKNEILLMDKSKSSWIVGYMAKNAGGSDVNVQVANENIKFTYKTLGEIATAVGTTEGTLTGLLNFGNDQTNKAYFSTQVIMKSCIRFGSDELYNSTHKFSPDFSSGTSSNGVIDVYDYSTTRYLFKGDYNLSISTKENAKRFFREAVIVEKDYWKADIAGLLGQSYFMTVAQLNILKSYNGTYVKYNGEYYKLLVAETGTQDFTVNNIQNSPLNNALYLTSNKAVELSNGVLTTGAYDPSKPREYALSEIKSKDQVVIISLQHLTSSDFIPQLKTKISSGRRTTGDQEYDIFAIPLDLKINNNGTIFETIHDFSRRIASAIGIQQSQKVYDLQLLPYCPLPDFVTSDNELTITNLVADEDYNFIYKNQSDTVEQVVTKDDITFLQIGDNSWVASVTVTLVVPAGKTAVVEEVRPVVLPYPWSASNISTSQVGNDLTITFECSADPASASTKYDFHIYYHYQDDDIPCGIIFYLAKSTFQTIINQQVNVTASKKVVSNCYNWRLNSPNYQGSFDFNIAKNGGSVLSFNVFCTYKPFTPFIKVSPNFEWLYGMEYQDNRGLICAGDFSLPRVQDEWVTYQINNKNYQNIFNRDIQHLDFMQSIEMRNQLISGGVGILSDASKGAGAGALVKGGWGALAGGLIGGAASALGFAIDTDTLARTQRENRQLAIDKFNYQLGNIKALPYTLTKVGSFDIISKIFPFVEEYSCSDEELEAFEKKIKYESMTIMRIGTLSEFMNFDGELHYFKGALIRNDEIADDSHVLNAIYEELLKGVYI